MSAAAPTRRSIDAGDYLCNQLLYLSLGLTAAPAGFIHVPRPRGRTPKARLKAPRPTLAAVARAVEAAILVLSRGTRRLAP
jgi:pyroglutamyl-peptidase